MVGIEATTRDICGILDGYKSLQKQKLMIQSTKKKMMKGEITEGEMKIIIGELNSNIKEEEQGLKEDLGTYKRNVAIYGQYNQIMSK